MGGNVAVESVGTSVADVVRDVGAADATGVAGVASVASVADAVGSEFSWLDPHPIFVIVLVGADEKPFGIQKDFLCAKCQYFREHFSTGKDMAIEHIVRLPNTSVQVFSHAQNFLFTGNVSSSVDQMPSYDVLVGIWKLGHSLGIDGLCERTLEAMCEFKRATRSIPATPLLVQVWKDTPEGSSIRQLLLSWAAEYLRSSQERSEFARSLPQELLSELVVAMSSYGDGFLSVGSAAANKNIHYLDGGGDDDGGDDSSIAGGGGGGDSSQSPSNKRTRYADFYASGHGPSGNSNSVGGDGGGGGGGTAMSTSGTLVNGGTGIAAAHKKQGRTSLPMQRMSMTKKRGHVVDVDAYTASQKLRFCSDLLTRMLSGPGFWTRLVGPFREPVDPATEGIPDYLDKIKRPMDLSTIKANLDSGRYRSEDEFAADIRQIFSNVYTYWSKGDAIWTVCERLEKTFEEKYAQMSKWLGKMDSEEFF